MKKILRITTIAILVMVGAMCINENNVQAAQAKTSKKTKVSLTLNKSSLSLQGNKSVRLSPSLKWIRGGVKWTSSNPKVAKVNSTGKVTGVKPGKAVIQVKSKVNSQLKAKCTVKVTAAKKTPVKPQTNVINEKDLKNSLVRTSYCDAFSNVIVNDYNSLQQLISEYEKKIFYSDSVLDKLKSYDKTYFDKYSLCLNSISVTNGLSVQLKDVESKQRGTECYDIIAPVSVIDNRKPSYGYTADMICYVYFMEVPHKMPGDSTVKFDIEYSKNS